MPIILQKRTCHVEKPNGAQETAEAIKGDYVSHLFKEMSTVVKIDCMLGVALPPTKQSRQK